MIRQLDKAELPLAAEVIRASFLTVANDLGLTEENCPRYVGFVTTAERLQTQLGWGWSVFGLFEDELLIGYVSISKVSADGDTETVDDAYEIHNLAVLPERRHEGYGRQLLDFCVGKIKEFDGSKIQISIVEENIVLRNWYAVYGFIHTGTKKYDHLPFTSGYMEMEIL